MTRRRPSWLTTGNTDNVPSLPEEIFQYIRDGSRVSIQNMCCLFSEECGDCRIQIDSSLAGLPEQTSNGSLSLRRPTLPQPLITVTINPLEKNEMTFVPPSPMAEGRRRLEEDERKLSIGSASSLDEDPELDGHTLGLRNCDIRRVSDISHINELRREISGLSHLASEYYEVKKIDPDKLSLDSIHLRVLSRCTKYQMIESKSDRASRYFVIITTSLTIFGISCGFWYRNFSGFAEDATH